MKAYELSQAPTLEAHRRELYGDALSEALRALPPISDRKSDSDCVAVSFDLRLTPETGNFAFYYRGEFWRVDGGTLWPGRRYSEYLTQGSHLLDIETALVDDSLIVTALNGLLLSINRLWPSVTTLRGFCTHVGIAWLATDFPEETADWAAFQMGALINGDKVSSDDFALTELTLLLEAVQQWDCYWSMNGLPKEDPMVSWWRSRATRKLNLRLCS